MTNADPFANTDNTATTTEPTKAGTIPSSADSKVVVTMKGGAGFEQPWIVVHADDAADARATIEGPEMEALIEAVRGTATKFSGSAPAAAPAKTSNGQPTASQQAPNGQTPPPGYMFKSGMGKNGKPWSAFMPIDRNSGLDPIWL